MKTRPLPQHAPAAAGLIADRLALADTIVAEAVEKENVPGAVLLIARHGVIAFRKAYGYAGLRPVKRPVFVDTPYDLASCTKPVATATSAMQLIERNAVVLDTPIARYLPQFRDPALGDKRWITVRHLLTHASGLPGGIALNGRKYTLPEMVTHIAQDARLRSFPGTRFLYSDLNAILMGAIITTVTGMDLNEYSHRFVFGPLGMSSTMYTPPPALAVRCAAITSGDDTPARRGKVHDPTAAALGGVSGNAGLYSTVDDLARYAQMILNRGIYDGVRILRPETIRQMTTSQSTFDPATDGIRSLGWDIDTGYSIRGLLPTATSRPPELPRGSFGHTGFTGTSIWIDPKTQTFIVLLTNAVHADPAIESGVARRVIRLRRQVSSIVASAIPELGFPAVSLAAQ